MARLETKRPMMHGGDLASASKSYGQPENGWIDLSTGISPHAYPYDIKNLSQESLRRLPDTSLYEALKRAAASAYGIESLDQLALASGSQGLIQVLPHLLAGKTFAIVSPTYSEHEKSWARSGCTILNVSEPEDGAARADILLVVNPNNPTGRLFPKEQLLALADQMTRAGRWLIVDEAFADLNPAESLASHCFDMNLIVLKSIGKFFGLAGLRVGFSISPVAMASRLTDHIGPWPISGPALVIAADALADHSWQAEQRLRLKALQHRLDACLATYNLSPMGACDLFRLLDIEGAQELQRHLAQHGIWTRIFDYNPRWLRLGLPHETGDDFQRLKNALADWQTRAGEESEQADAP